MLITLQQQEMGQSYIINIIKELRVKYREKETLYFYQILSHIYVIVYSSTSREKQVYGNNQLQSTQPRYLLLKNTLHK